MIFEPKTDFSERDISLDTLNEERRFWAKEGDSKNCRLVIAQKLIRQKIFFSQYTPYLIFVLFFNIHHYT
ncbi:hypothetical protein HYS01_02740 [Candidatus Saccharibacteria bacterium]|nr:hypothetical protein [Candidatus Saccharibacteria bacterium]